MCCNRLNPAASGAAGDYPMAKNRYQGQDFLFYTSDVSLICSLRDDTQHFVSSLLTGRLKRNLLCRTQPKHELERFCCPSPTDSVFITTYINQLSRTETQSTQRPTNKETIYRFSGDLMMMGTWLDVFLKQPDIFLFDLRAFTLHCQGFC